MAPQRIMFTRHAEKPYDADEATVAEAAEAKKDHKTDYLGVTSKGNENKDSLIVRGWQRAGALVRFFSPNRENSQYPMIPPDTIFACAYGSDGGGSKRPQETVKPLSDFLMNAKFVTTIYRDDHKGLIDAVMACEGTVLVAWEHKAIVSDILPALPVSNASDLPTHWSGKRFDVVLRFDRAAGATDFSFTELFPCLMPGDSDKPLKSDPTDE